MDEEQLDRARRQRLEKALADFPDDVAFSIESAAKLAAKIAETPMPDETDGGAR